MQFGLAQFFITELIIARKINKKKKHFLFVEVKRDTIVCVTCFILHLLLPLVVVVTLCRLYQVYYYQSFHSGKKKDKPNELCKTVTFFFGNSCSRNVQVENGRRTGKRKL